MAIWFSFSTATIRSCLCGTVLSHRDLALADGGRARLRAVWRELFKSFDAVICPVMPTPAHLHGHSPEQEKRPINIDGKDHVYPDQLAWPGAATVPGLPATAIPIGLSPEGLPIGVQIVGSWLEDRAPLKLAELIEREFGGFVPPLMFGGLELVQPSQPVRKVEVQKRRARFEW